MYNTDQCVSLAQEVLLLLLLLGLGLYPARKPNLVADSTAACLMPPPPLHPSQMPRLGLDPERDSCPFRRQFVLAAFVENKKYIAIGIIWNLEKNPRINDFPDVTRVYWVRNIQIELFVVPIMFEFEIYYLGKYPLWSGLLLTCFYEPVVSMSSAEMARGALLRAFSDASHIRFHNSPGFGEIKWGLVSSAVKGKHCEAQPVLMIRLFTPCWNS